MSKLRSSHIAWLAAVSVCVLVGSFTLSYSDRFFRDYAIIFEGAYRISVGQLPYRDFYINLGPVTFYMQAAFNLLFGATYLSAAVHGAALAVVLAAVLFGLARPRVGSLLAFFLAASTVYSLNAFHPWYNQTALFFFSLGLLLLYGRSEDQDAGGRMPLVMALLTVLAFYSKQDVGLLQFVLLAGYFLFGGGRLAWRPALLFVGASVGAGLLLAWLFSQWGDFRYWFNLGQPPHTSRLALLLENPLFYLGSYRLYIALLAALAFFWADLRAPVRRKLCLLAMAAVLPMVIARTSGNGYRTETQCLPFIVLVIHDLFSGAILPSLSGPAAARGRLVAGLTAVAALCVTLNPLAQFWPNILHAVQPQRWQEVRIDSGSYRGSLLKPDEYAGLQRIRSKLTERHASFFNMSEYQFLYTDYQVIPPTGVSLWFDYGTSLFAADLPKLKARILELRPEIILLQDPHWHDDPTLNDALRQFFVANGYGVAFSVPAPAEKTIDVLERMN